MSSKHRPTEGPLWIFPKQDPSWTKQIIDEFNIHPVTAQVLVSRKFKDLEEIHDFLYAKLPDLHDPDLFLDMDIAVARVLKALQNKEKILVYGDNDVGWNHGCHSPNRVLPVSRLAGSRLHFQSDSPQ